MNVLLSTCCFGCATYTNVYNQVEKFSPVLEVRDMQETNVVELRKRIKHFFDAVESGEVVRVYRNGKPIAEILPLTGRQVSWKCEAPRLTIPGLSLSHEILKDRAESDS